MAQTTRVQQILALPGNPRGVGGCLGINYNAMHDSAVALLDADGDLMYAASEERFTRVKQDGRFPRHSLRPVTVRDVAAIGVPYLDACPEPVATDAQFAHMLHPTTLPLMPFPPRWRERLEALGRPLMYFDHHEMHAYTGFVLSGYEEALVLTSDYGAPTCPVTTAVYHLMPGRRARLASVSANDHVPLAGMYSDVTALLGFTPCRHEGKVTGLAAHGRPSHDCRAQLWQLHRTIQHDRHTLYDWVGFLGDETPPCLETNRYLAQHYRAQLQFSDADIARAAQDLLDERLLRIARWIGETYGHALPLILSGGVFANVRSNMEIARVGFPKVFVAPPMGDDGLCVGAAAAAHEALAEAGDRPPRKVSARQTTAPVAMTVGPGVGDDVDALLRRHGVQYRRAGDALAHELAVALAAGRTVALVRGRQEFGPRALGHRSILASPADVSINHSLNEKLRRTEFMPFAPIVRAERAADVFDLSAIASDVADCLPFMTICVPVHEWVTDLAPAVVHVDGTARPQTVAVEHDPFLHQVLAHFEESTGIPLLINTSFNTHDEPLVSNARDALLGFFDAELDLLCLDERLIDIQYNDLVRQVVRLARPTNGASANGRVKALSESFGQQIVCGPGRFSSGLAPFTAGVSR
jgi:carbamoyltransferase